MIRTLDTLIYDCPNSTSNGPPPLQADPLEKTVSKVGGSPAKLGVRTRRPPSGCALGKVSLSRAYNN
jgi:hypothetical protein